MDEIISKIFKNYCMEVLCDILPKQQVLGISSSSTLDNVHLNPLNEAFIGSSYYIKAADKKFVHFTSLEKLTNILIETSFRLFDLNFVDDKNEILFPFEYCNLSIPNFKKSDIHHLRKNILSFSFCDADMNEMEEYNLWKLYGKDGTGIAIIFTFENNESEWDGFHLSKIHYNDSNLLQKIKEAYSKFNIFFKDLEQQHNYKKGNEYFLFLNHILSLLAFHKVNIYKSEHEYRLIYHANNLSQPKQSPFNVEKNRILNKENKVSKFFKAPLTLNNSEKRPNPKIPLIKIDSIKFGYRYSDEDFNIIKDSLNEIMGYNLIKGREFIMTALKKKYF